MLLGKALKVLISKALINSNVIHEKFVLANNVLTYERNDVETLVDGILWLNKKKLIEETLDHKNLQEITTKYYSDHRKHRCEIVDVPKNNPKEFS